MDRLTFLAAVYGGHTVFRTLNSLYAVDRDNKRVCRIEGLNAPTGRQLEDGQWQECGWIGDVVVGMPLSYQTGPGLWDGVRTSTVLEIYSLGTEEKHVE